MRKLSVAFMIFSLSTQAFAQQQPQMIPSHTTTTSPESVLRAKRLFERLTGVDLLPNTPQFRDIIKAVNDGDDQAAAALITENPYFYQITVKNMAAGMSNRSETPFVPLDDFQATFIGAVRDGLDARTLLTGNYIYRAQGLQAEEPSRRNNNHYELIDTAQAFYKDVLVKQEPQWSDFRNHAGLLTTRGWAKAHYDAGTNRRAVQYSFQEFLCLPIDSWKVAGLIDTFVGRDVDRAPGKNPLVYQEQCRTCHAGMDAMKGAFASVDYLNDSLVELPEGRPAPKYSRNTGTYPQGYITRDDSWTNLIAAHQPTIGFKEEEPHGKGINAFGDMLANTKAFRDCMTTRAFAAVCQRNPEPRDNAALRVAASNFEKNGFNLKKLFQEVAVLPACLGD